MSEHKPMTREEALRRIRMAKQRKQQTIERLQAYLEEKHNSEIDKSTNS